jgi:hypothetical protein
MRSNADGLPMSLDMLTSRGSFDFADADTGWMRERASCQAARDLIGQRC